MDVNENLNVNVNEALKCQSVLTYMWQSVEKETRQERFYLNKPDLKALH